MRLIFIIPIFIATTVIGQINTDSHFTVISKLDGLTSNIVNSIIQDDNGVMWFATDNGLSSFNGVEYTSYTPENSSIPHHRIFDFAKDTSGMLWAATGEGICKINPFSLTFTVYNIENGYNELKNDYITNVEIDTENRLWIANTSSLCELNVQSDTIYSYNIINSGAPFIHKIEVGDNCVWVSINNRLMLFNKESYESKTVLDMKMKTSSTKNEIISSLDYDNGVLWCSSNFGSLFKISLTDTVIQKIDLPIKNQKEVIMNVFVDGDILNVLINKHGIYKYSIAENHGAMISNNLFSIVDNKSLKYMYKDMHNNVWISLYGIGVAYTTPYSNFHLYNSSSPNFNSITSNIVSSIYIKENKILIGTDGGGLYEYSDEKLKKLSFKPNEILSINKIEGIDGVWIGTYADGVYNCSFDSNISVSKNLRKENGILTSNDVRKSIIDSSGVLWFVTHGNGVLSYNPITKKKKSYSTLNGLSGDWTYNIVCDRNNKKWVATNNGLCGIDSAGNVNVLIKSYNVFLADNFVTSLYIYKNKLWCGTQEGLCIYDLYTHKFQQPKSEIVGSCNSIIDDDNGNVWVGTNNGLIKLNEEGEIIIDYRGGNKIPAINFSNNCVVKNEDGILYWGTSRGLLFFNPDSLIKSEKKPVLSLKAIKVNNAPFDSTPSIYSKNKKVYKLPSLNHNENYVEFSFNIINYSESRESKLQYHLNGLDTIQVIEKNTNAIFYKALPAGKYSLEVFAANENEQWTDKPIIISFEIRPPFYGTWWFRIMLILLIVLLAFSFYLYKTRQIRIQKKQLEKEVNSRTTELTKTLHDLEIEKLTVDAQNEELTLITDKLQEQNNMLDEANKTKSRFMSIIAHDIKNPFSAVIGLSDLLDKNYPSYDDTKKIKFIKQIKTSANLIHSHLTNMLDWALGQADKLSPQPEHFHLKDVVVDVFNLLDSLFQRKQHEFKNKIEQDCVVFADRDMTYTVLRNLIGNANKYTPNNGTITIKSSGDRDGFWKIIVEDTGIGLDEANISQILNPNKNYSTVGTDNEPGTGLGISICKQFVELNNGQLEIKSILGSGSQFSISIPKGDIAKVKEKKPELAPEISTDVNEEPDIFLQPMKSKTVIVVEDNVAIKEHLENELSRYFNVLSTNNGIKGLRLINNYIPDIVLTDVEMPFMDGFELCEKIKTSIQTSHIPVIVITARKSDTDKIEGLKYGANDYIGKPYHINEILLKIKNLLQTTEQQQKRYSIQNKDFSIYNSIDERFIKKFMMLLEEQYKDPAISIEKIGSEIGMSRSNLYKKVIALTGKSPNDLLQEIRINNALHLLKKTDLSISEIAYEVGYNDSRYFSSRFKSFTGKTPTEIRGDSRK